jgi:hypothetical protein
MTGESEAGNCCASRNFLSLTLVLEAACVRYPRDPLRAKHAKLEKVIPG